METYNDSSCVPVTLSNCGHTWCRSCLVGLHSSLCPSCRTPIPSPIDQLKPSYALMAAGMSEVRRTGWMHMRFPCSHAPPAFRSMQSSGGNAGVIELLERCNLSGAADLALDPSSVLLERLMHTPGAAELWMGTWRGSKVTHHPLHSRGAMHACLHAGECVPAFRQGETRGQEKCPALTRLR